MVNVRAQVATLLKRPVVEQSVKSGQLLVVGAFYEMSSGIVDFYTDS